MNVPEKVIVRCIHCQVPIVLGDDKRVPPHRHAEPGNPTLFVPCRFSGSKSYEEIKKGGKSER
jgi:hypothetical protein